MPPEEPAIEYLGNEWGDSRRTRIALDTRDKSQGCSFMGLGVINEISLRLGLGRNEGSGGRRVLARRGTAGKKAALAVPHLKARREWLTSGSKCYVTR